MKISLRNLEKSRLVLSEKDMEHLRGGGDGVRCGCLYAGTPGGASTADNKAANEAGSLWTVPPDGSDSGSGSSGSDLLNYRHVEVPDAIDWVNKGKPRRQ